MKTLNVVLLISSLALAPTLAHATNPIPAIAAAEKATKVAKQLRGLGETPDESIFKRDRSLRTPETTRAIGVLGSYIRAKTAGQDLDWDSKLSIRIAPGIHVTHADRVVGVERGAGGAHARGLKAKHVMNMDPKVVVETLKETARRVEAGEEVPVERIHYSSGWSWGN